MLSRTYTNLIRDILDNHLPKFLRNSKIFMFPFYSLWLKTLNINWVQKIMNFKSWVYTLSEEELEAFFSDFECATNDRATDLNERCIKNISSFIKNAKIKSIIDAGSGRGYLVKLLVKETNSRVTACDLYESANYDHVKYVKGTLRIFPFPQNLLMLFSAAIRLNTC